MSKGETVRTFSAAQPSGTLRFRSLCRLDKREKMRKDGNIVNLENIPVNHTSKETTLACLDPVPVAPDLRDETIRNYLLTSFPSILAQVQSGRLLRDFPFASLS